MASLRLTHCQEISQLLLTPLTAIVSWAASLQHLGSSHSWQTLYSTVYRVQYSFHWKRIKFSIKLRKGYPFLVKMKNSDQLRTFIERDLKKWHQRTSCPPECVFLWRKFPIKQNTQHLPSSPCSVPRAVTHTEQWLSPLSLLGFNETWTAWKEHVSSGNVIPAPKNHIKVTVHLALPSPAWMQAQAGASRVRISQDTSRMSLLNWKAVRKIKKIRMFTAVVSQRQLYDSRTRWRSAAVKKTC